MTIRAAGPASGLSWLVRAIDPRATHLPTVFGAGMLFLGGVFAVALLVGGLSGAAGPQADAGTFQRRLMTGAVVMAALAGLMAGFLQLLHAIEHRRPARPLDVFGGYRNAGVALRATVFIGLLALVQNTLAGWIVTTHAPGFIEWYLQLAEAAQQTAPSQPATPPPPPPGLGTAFVLIVALGLVGFALQAIGLGQIALHGRGVLQALGDGLRGIVANLMPLLVLALAALVAGFVLALLLGMALMLLGAVASLAGPQAGALVLVPAYLLLMLAGYVVMFRVMYHLWRDVCGDAAPPAAAGNQVAL